MPDVLRRYTGRGWITAYELFQKGMAPVVITTGGAAQDPDFSEGGVGRDYLLRRGVPEQALIAETQGSDTAQSAARVANIMRANGMRTLHRGERCVSCIPHSRLAGARRRASGVGAQARVASASAMGAVHGGDARGDELSGLEGRDDLEQLLATGFWLLADSLPKYP